MIQIRVPPLRERLEDLMGISERVLERLARDAGVWPAPRLTRDALVHLSRYPFPGNVRELENLLHRAVALSGAEELDVYDLGLPESVFTDSAAQELDQIASAAETADRGRARPGAGWRRSRSRCPTTWRSYLDDVERDILVRALEHHRFNRTAAGISLGLSLRQMRYRMARLNVNVGGDAGQRRTASERAASGAAAGSAARARVPSPNFGPRPPATPVDLVVLHSISLPPGEYGGDAVERLFTNALDWSAHPYFETIRGLEVSAHFFVRRDGELVQFVSCDERAWHAGASCWHGRDDCNDFSIGIELEGLEGETFEAAQYATLAALLASLARRYPIAAVAGHEHVAPGRKHDPGAGFDWARLRRLASAPALRFGA